MKSNLRNYKKCWLFFNSLLMQQILCKTLMLHPGLKREVILSNGQQGAIPLVSNIDCIEHGHSQHDVGQLRQFNDLKMWMSRSSSFLRPDTCWLLSHTPNSFIIGDTVDVDEWLKNSPPSKFLRTCKPSTDVKTTFVPTCKYVFNAVNVAS